MATTSIEWTERVINPSTGCDKVSPGCDNCYALTMAKRLKAMGNPKYQTDGDPRTSGPGFGFAMHPQVMQVALRTRKPTRWFVNSMSDLFHAHATREFLAGVFAVMAATPQHTYQILTKRPLRACRILSNDAFRLEVIKSARDLDDDRISPMWPLPNVHLGTSVEDQKSADERIPHLLATPAAVRWISAEPLLGPIDLEFIHYFDPGCCGCDPTWGVHEPTCGREPGKHWGLNWVVVGGESGHGARPMHPDWARSLRDRCTAADVPFLFKQWGEWAPAPWYGEDGATHAFTGTLCGDGTPHFMQLGHGPTSGERDLHTPRGAQGMRRVDKKAAGRELDGRTWDEYPQAVTTDA